MCDHCEVNLGFTDDKVAAGTHMCLIFSSDEERQESLLKFLLSGLESGERTACFSNRTDEKGVETFLNGYGISYEDKKREKAISLAGTTEVYFQDGRFDPERMLNTLSYFYTESIAMGFPAARVIGEMTPEVEKVPGGDRLLEYESRVSMLLREHPVTSVCQYDATLFDGATILEILKVHPKMIINGAVVNNPFFIAPEEYLKGI